jgi:hypothetical protein
MTKQRNARYMNRTHKFGIAIPKTIQEAFDLDHTNGNTLWADAIAKELKDIRIAFKILDPSDPDPVGYQKICCHMVLMSKWKTFAVKHGLSLVAM